MIRSLLYSLSLAGMCCCTSLYGQGVMIPDGSGAWGNQVYLSGSVTNKQAYSPEPGGILSMGFGLGNPEKNVGLQLTGNLLHLQNLYTVDVKLHRYLGYGTTVAIGSRNLLQFNLINDFRNFYLVFSHDFKYNCPPRNLFSRLAFSMGGGYGTSFSQTMPKDIIREKEAEGTYVFGALQFRLSNHFLVTAEWTGINLNTFLTIQRQLGQFPVALYLGFADLTPYSGDRILAMGGMSVGYRFR